jgi:hypothetical protein
MARHRWNETGIALHARLTRAYLLAGCVLLAATLFALPARADDDDLPARVGRVALHQGELLLAPEDRADEWSPIGLNYPVTSGDSLWVGADGTAEIDYGGGQFRLAAVTNVHVSRLDDRQLALFIAEGRLIVRVRFLDPGESARVDTPSGQVTLLRPGLYRIDVAPDRNGLTTVVVREGEASVAIASAVQQVLPGQTATIDGTDVARVLVRNGSGVDGFDTWSGNRERVYERGTATPYVSRQMVGAADLDAYGNWETYPEYGAVWFPTTVTGGWAPYRYGRWVTLPVWGSTWVDDAPWGYAPFHYGRWVYVGSRWGWCPGSYVARPVWAPAMVAWYGGSGWSVSTTYGSPVYGWVPLSWREPFHPWWGRCSAQCWTRYNRPYAVNPGERSRPPHASYVNWSAPGGVTAVPGAAFGGGRPVNGNIVALPTRAVNNAPLLREAPMPKPQPATGMVRAGNGVPAAASLYNPMSKPSPMGGATNRAVEAPSPVRAVPPAPYPGGSPELRRGSTPAYTDAPNAARSLPTPVTAVPPGNPQAAPRYIDRTPQQPGVAGAGPAERPLRVAPAKPAAVVAPSPVPALVERPTRSQAMPPGAPATIPREYRPVPQVAPAPVPREYRPAPQAAPVVPQGAQAPAPVPRPVAPAPQPAPAQAQRGAAPPAEPAPREAPGRGSGKQVNN